MYKLTMPTTLIDINGDIKETEKTFVFTSKEELSEFIHGDCDGDNYGSALIRIADKELYEAVGKMCNRISYLIADIAMNKPIDAWKDPFDKPARKPKKVVK